MPDKYDIIFLFSFFLFLHFDPCLKICWKRTVHDRRMAITMVILKFLFVNKRKNSVFFFKTFVRKLNKKTAAEDSQRAVTCESHNFWIIREKRWLDSGAYRRKKNKEKKKIIKVLFLPDYLGMRLRGATGLFRPSS